MKKSLILHISLTLLGAALGFAYYVYVGCTSGG